MEALELPWDELQDDLFASILNELDSPQVAWLCSVCSSWKKKTQKLLDCIQYNLSEAFPFEELVAQFPALKEVTVVFRGHHPQLAQMHRLGSLTRLRSLKLCNTRSVLEFPFLNLSVLEACPFLSELVVEGCRFEAQAGAQNLIRLRSLTLLRCAIHIREPSLAQILQGMEQLKILRIEHLAGGSCINLRGISSLAQLEHVMLRIRSAGHPETARELVRMHKLKTLDISIMHCPTVTTVDDVTLGALASLPALEELNLAGHCRVTDSGVEEISRLTNLTSLDVSGPSPIHLLMGHNVAGITDRGLRHLAPLMKLQSLNISFSKVSNRILSLLMQRFERLKHLTIAHCNHMNDTALFNLDRCPHLTSLDVSYCRQVSDLGLIGISKVARQLRALNISGCHRLVSDLGLRHLAGLHLLTWISLAYCEQITDYGIEQLTSGTAYLKTLALRGCHQLTNRTVDIISATLPHLCDLDLGQCHRISDSAVDKLLSIRCLRRIALNEAGVSNEGCLHLREKGIAVQRENRWWMH